MDFMSQAIELAKKGSGYTSPNPLVGAVLVKNGLIVGSGYHRKAGTDHAEIVALKRAGRRARGSTLYVNLEPCCHQGRTGPCTRALIAEGITEVHCAMLDPNPQVRGRGKWELEAAGITVVVGEQRETAERLNEIFTKYITAKRPFVLAKWAMSLDGTLTTRPGQSPWISSVASRRRVHPIEPRPPPRLERHVQPDPGQLAAWTTSGRAGVRVGHGIIAFLGQGRQRNRFRQRRQY